ncbi:MAG: dihydrodipicolinate synthase family protein, partial [Selenomonadaceae bacterium]|nr:dihydrodipicolinate synthase family protein [Selenomonadaceae bacterium]
IQTPVILYNVPGRTGVDIKPESYCKLSKHPRIVAAKEANGDLTSILRTRKLCGNDLAIYSGNDDQIIPILSLGGSGVISVLANVAPYDTHMICQNYFDGKVDEASRMQIDYCDLIDALFCEVNPIPVKVAMRLRGWNVGELRMPLCEPEPKHLEQIKTAMKAHGLL